MGSKTMKSMLRAAAVCGLIALTVWLHINWAFQRSMAFPPAEDCEIWIARYSDSKILYSLDRESKEKLFQLLQEGLELQGVRRYMGIFFDKTPIQSQDKAVDIQIRTAQKNHRLIVSYNAEINYVFYKENQFKVSTNDSVMALLEELYAKAG